MINAILIIGPTGSGKTTQSLRLATSYPSYSILGGDEGLDAYQDVYGNPYILKQVKESDTDLILVGNALSVPQVFKKLLPLANVTVVAIQTGPKECEQRLTSRGDIAFNLERYRMYNRFIEDLKEMEPTFPFNLVVVDGNKTVTEVTEDIINGLTQL